MPKYKIVTISNAGKVVEKLDHLYAYSEKSKMIQPLWKTA